MFDVALQLIDLKMIYTACQLVGLIVESFEGDNYYKVLIIVHVPYEIAIHGGASTQTI